MAPSNSTITIEQIVPSGGRGKSITLDGLALPDEWWSAPVKYREVVSWAPGSTAPVVQKIGLEVGNVTLKGEWDEARLGEFARANHEALYGMVRDGYDVVVRQSGDLLGRRCGIVEYTPEFQGAPGDMFGRVKWTLVLSSREIEGRKPETVTIGAIEFGDLKAEAQAFAAQAAAQQAAAEAAAQASFAQAVAVGGVSLAATQIADVMAFNAAMQTAAASMVTAIDGLGRGTVSTEAVLLAAADAGRIGTQGAFGAAGASAGESGAELSTATDTLDAWEWPTIMRLSYINGMRMGEQLQQAAEQIVSGGTERKTYTVVAGDTFASIAQAQLGDWQRWQEVADINNLSPASTLDPATVIVLPPIQSVVRRDLAVWDYDIPTTGQTTQLGMTATGDIALITGDESLSRWGIHAALTTPGTYYGDTSFGAGLQRATSRPVSAMGGALQLLRDALAQHPRVVSSAVQAKADPSVPGRVLVNVLIQTPDDLPPATLQIVV